jgi:hypothetical protein
MEQIKQQIISFLSITLVLAVLFPSVVKMQHVFENHKHEVCKGEKQSHFHEIDFDCEFYKFNLTSFTYNFIKYPDFQKTSISNKTVNPLAVELIQLPDTNPKQLRAPPLFYFS